MKHTAIKKQQGVVLIWALAILLILTILGISSVKKANMGTKIAGNSMASMIVFQGAESALGRISRNMEYMDQVAILGIGQEIAVPAAALPNEQVTGGNIRSQAVVEYVTDGACPLMNNVANQEATVCGVFQFEVESRLQGTGARTVHILGVAHLLPNSD